MRARGVLPTRKGPSMTIKLGGWRLRCGTRARLAAEESLPGIVSCDHGRAGINKRIIAESRTQSSGVCAYSMGVTCRGKKVKHFHIYILVLPFEKTQTAELEAGTNKNVTNGPVPPDLLASILLSLRVGMDLQHPRTILRWQMVVAALLLICSIPQMDDVARVVNDSPAIVSDSATRDSVALASAPAPKVKTDAEPIAPSPAGLPFQPVKPVYTRPQETPRQREIWYGLLLAGHSGAAFHAWSTHQAVLGRDGQGGNPCLRPFAESDAAS